MSNVIAQYEGLNDSHPAAFNPEATKVVLEGANVGEYQKVLSNISMRKAVQMFGEQPLIEMATRQFNTDVSNAIRAAAKTPNVVGKRGINAFLSKAEDFVTSGEIEQAVSLLNQALVTLALCGASEKELMPLSDKLASLR